MPIDRLVLQILVDAYISVCLNTITKCIFFDNVLSVEDASEGDSSNKKNRKCSFKREYGKLKTMVPALGEREDLTKVSSSDTTVCFTDLWMDF